MNNKKDKRNDDYSQIRTKIFIRTIIMVVATITIIFLLYSVVLRGRFGDFVVTALQKIFNIEYEMAMNFYTQTFRDYMDLFLLAAMLLVFFIIFRIHLKWFTRYFAEINQGIDSLLKEDAEDVSLSPELSATEKKINTIKHILEKQKLDTQSAEQRKNDLVVYLAHDLKTPLTSVIGYLTLLRDEGQISEELREKYLSISLDKAEQLEDLINEFFEITRFNFSDITLQYSRVNMTRLLEQLAFEFKPMLADKNLECSLSVKLDMMVRCDVNKMQRVFDNLLRNAVFYSFENSTIKIIAAQKDNEVIIKFANHGDTIPQEKLGRIFEQFYRLDTSRSSNSGGAGLGLAIAKEIVELHKGRITAKSENEFTEFDVILPLS